MLVRKDKVIRIMEEVVAEYGEDYTVDRCFYTDFEDRSKPNCIAAQVLYRIDPLSIRRIYDRNLDGSDLSTLFENNRADAILPNHKFSKNARKALMYAQRSQDGRDLEDLGSGSQDMRRDRTWGTALNRARSA